MKKMFVYRLVSFFLVLLVSLGYFVHTLILPRGMMACEWEKNTETYINAYTMTPFGHRIAIGKENGEVTVYTSEGDSVYEHIFGQPVQELFFSFDGNYLFVKTQNLLKIDLQSKAVLWEKFLANYYVSDFWIYQNGHLGFIFASKTKFSYSFLLANANGATIHQFELPELYEHFEFASSYAGNYLLVVSESSDLYHISFEGMVNWMMRLDPPALKVNEQHPILFDINDQGDVCLAYSFEQYGNKGHMVVYMDESGKTLWQYNLNRPLLQVQFSKDGQKILINTSDELYVFRLDGDALFHVDQLGYHSLYTYLFPNRLLVNYFSKNLYLTNGWTNKRELPNYSILQLFSLDQKELKWQKKMNLQHQSYLVSSDGKGLLEVIRPNKIRWYVYVQKK